MTGSENRIGEHKDKAIKVLELMQQATDAGDYKVAMHHKIIANVVMDEMVNTSW
jgi:hypothetical protein